MEDSAFPRILLTHRELVQSAQIMEARFSDPAQEEARLEAARRFLNDALALERALRAHSHCALVNHAGSLGTTALCEQVDDLYVALVRYTDGVRGLAKRAGTGAPEEARRTGGPQLEVA
jgi:hypothetical protein